jgi:hypothetical protein
MRPALVWVRVASLLLVCPSLSSREMMYSMETMVRTSEAPLSIVHSWVACYNRRLVHIALRLMSMLPILLDCPLPGNDVLYGQRGDDGKVDFLLTFEPLLEDLLTGLLALELYGGDGEDECIGGLGADLLDGGAGNDILLGDAGYAVRRFDQTGSPRLNAVTARTDSEYVWHKDIVLEEVGRITSSHLISKRLDINSLQAEDIALASLLIVANEFSGGSQTTNATRGGWPTELILFDYESSRNDDKLYGGTGDDICIGQVRRCA